MKKRKVVLVTRHYEMSSKEEVRVDGRVVFHNMSGYGASDFKAGLLKGFALARVPVQDLGEESVYEYSDR